MIRVGHDVAWSTLICSSTPVNFPDGLSSLSSVRGIFIQYNPSLTNLDGLSSLTSLEDSLQIGNNSSLADLNGLSGLSAVGG